MHASSWPRSPMILLPKFTESTYVSLAGLVRIWKRTSYCNGFLVPEARRRLVGGGGWRRRSWDETAPGRSHDGGKKARRETLRLVSGTGTTEREAMRNWMNRARDGRKNQTLTPRNPGTTCSSSQSRYRYRYF